MAPSWPLSSTPPARETSYIRLALRHASEGSASAHRLQHRVLQLSELSPDPRCRCSGARFHKSYIQHRARPVCPAHHRCHRTFAGLRDQPVDIVSGNKSACRNRQNLGPARRAPCLDLSDLITIQQHSVTPAPPSERVYFSTWFYSQSRPYCLLYCHSDFL